MYVVHICFKYRYVNTTKQVRINGKNQCVITVGHLFPETTRMKRSNPYPWLVSYVQLDVEPIIFIFDKNLMERVGGQTFNNTDKFQYLFVFVGFYFFKCYKYTLRNFGWFRTFIIPRPYHDSSHWNYFRKSPMKEVLKNFTFEYSSNNNIFSFVAMSVDSVPSSKTNIFQSKLIYCRHLRTYSRCAMFDWSDTVFRWRNVTRRRISGLTLVLSFSWSLKM